MKVKSGIKGFVSSREGGQAQEFTRLKKRVPMALKWINNKG
jgi:hypothetical protein